VYRAQVIGTGGNYADHATEVSATIQVSEPVSYPSCGAPSSARTTDRHPTPDTQTDYEVEFAV